MATPNALNNTCGGTATAVAGSGSVSLSGGTLAASASCTVSVNVQGTTAGVKNNSVQVTSTEGGTGNTSNASITVVAPPVIIKAFGAASIPLNGSTSLTFTIQNNNTTTALTGVGFSDTLPAGLVVSTPNGLTGSCGGGTITATQGTNVISLSGGTIAAKHFLHVLSERDGHCRRHTEQHHRQRDFNRRRHGRNGFCLHQRGCAAVDCQGLQSSQHRAERNDFADVHDHQSSSERRCADRSSIY